MLRNLLWWLADAIAHKLDVCVVLNRDNYTDEYGQLLIAKQFVCNHDH